MRVCVRACVHAYLCVYACVRVCTHMCTHAWASISEQVCAYVLACVCVCALCSYVRVQAVYKCLTGFNNEIGCGRSLGLLNNTGGYFAPVNHKLIKFQVSVYNCVICIPFLISSPDFKKFPLKI